MGVEALGGAVAEILKLVNILGPVGAVVTIIAFVMVQQRRADGPDPVVTLAGELAGVQGELSAMRGDVSDVKTAVSQMSNDFAAMKAVVDLIIAGKVDMHK